MCPNLFAGFVNFVDFENVFLNFCSCSENVSHCESSSLSDSHFHVTTLNTTHLDWPQTIVRTCHSCLYFPMVLCVDAMVAWPHWPVGHGRKTTSTGSWEPEQGDHGEELGREEGTVLWTPEGLVLQPLLSLRVCVCYHPVNFCNNNLQVSNPWTGSSLIDWTQKSDTQPGQMQS